MTYSNEIITMAHNEIDRRRERAFEVLNSHVNVIKGYPDIYSIYTSLLSTKNKLAEVLLSKSGDIRERIEVIKNENLGNQALLIAKLSELGLSEDYLLPEYTCKRCCDKGYIAGERCDCLKELLDKYTVNELNRECKIKLKSFAEFDIRYYPETITTKSGATVEARALMEEQLKYCIDYAKRFSVDSPSVFMIGGTGLGKTFLSSCIAKEIISKGYSVAFDSIQNYLREIEKEHFGKSNDDTLETLLKADLLILDDLGSEFTTSFNSSVIYNIINSRTNQGKPTIISTNLSLDELDKRYDDRIISRLTGMFKPLRFIGNDIRQIKRQKGIYS